MGKVTHPIEIVGYNTTRKLVAMFDTGASNNFLPSIFSDGDKAEDIGFKEFLGTREFFMADETTTKGDVVKFDMLKIENMKIKEPIFVILDNLVDEAIIGTHLMQVLGLKIDMKSDKIL